MARPEWGDVVMPFSFFFFIFFRRFWKGSFRTKYKNVDLMVKDKWHKAARCEPVKEITIENNQFIRRR